MRCCVKKICLVAIRDLCSSAGRVTCRLQAMLDFMITNGYKESAEALKKESSVQPDPKAKGILEKKWASIVRMQKKVCISTLRCYVSFLR